MRNKKWTDEETVILIYGYLLIEQDNHKREHIIDEISTKFRLFYINCHETIDNTFRNKNGINMKLGNIQYLFTDGEHGFSNVSKLEKEMFLLYVNDKKKYFRLLKQALKKYDIKFQD